MNWVIKPLTKFLVLCASIALFVVLLMRLVPSHANPTVELDSKFTSFSVRDGCLRTLKIQNLIDGEIYGSKYQIENNNLIFNPPIEKEDDVILTFSLSSMGFNCVSGNNRFSVNISSSDGIDIVSAPRRIHKIQSNLGYIEQGKWDNSWLSDLQYVFHIKEPSHYREWIDLTISDTNISLGGKLFIRISAANNSSKNTQRHEKFKVFGVYSDDPNSISKLRDKYNLDTTPQHIKNASEFDLTKELDVQYFIINRVADFPETDGYRKEKIRKNLISYIQYIKKHSPTIKVILAIPSWRYKNFDSAIELSNSITELDGIALDWESETYSRQQVNNIFSKIREQLDHKKQFLCVSNSRSGTRGLFWDDVDQYCNYFLPMFYLPQQEHLLMSGYHWLEKWKNGKINLNKIIPIVIPIHKNSTHTKIPTSFTRQEIMLLRRYGINNFFLYRPYALSDEDFSLFIKNNARPDADENFRGERVCFKDKDDYEECIFDF